MKLLIILIFITACSSKNWRTTSRESINLAPKPETLKEDIFQIYYARAYSWRGVFGIHPWIAWKKKNEKQYSVAQVIGWNLRRQGTVVSITKDIPDRRWYDNEPTLLYESRGQKATEQIEAAIKEIENYPFADKYGLWPGPNSNTFVAHVIRESKNIPVELPPHAIGKDYFPSGEFAYKTPSNTGITLSAFGVLGLSVGLYEGIELNLLGLHFGFDLITPALKLPLAGRIGFPDTY